MVSGTWVPAGIIALQMFGFITVGKGESVTIRVDEDTHNTETEVMYVVPEKDVKLRDIFRREKPVELVNDDSTDWTVKLSFGYEGNAGVFIQLRERDTEIDLTSELELDVTQIVNDFVVYFDRSLCDTDGGPVKLLLVLQVINVKDNSMLGSTYFGNYVNLQCKEPRIMIHVNCPRGLGVMQKTIRTFMELCGPVRNVTVRANLRGMRVPSTNWKTLDGAALNGLDFDSERLNDITSHFDKMEINVPEGECDNHEQVLKFPITDGIITVTGYHSITALCPYNNLDMIITDNTPSTASQPWIVHGGDVASAVAQMDLTVSVDGNIPPLVYTDREGITKEAHFLVAMYLTDRPSSDITRAECYINKHVADVSGSDFVVGIPVRFKHDTDLDTIKSQLLESLQEETLDSACGQQTLIVAIDPIKSMTGENPCNNFLTFDLEFACDGSTVQQSKLAVTWNPFSDGEEHFIKYMGPGGTKGYLFRHHHWSNTFQQLQQGDEEKRGSWFGYGRLAVVQKLLSSEVKDTCPTVGVKEMLDEMEDVTEGGEAAAAELKVEGIEAVEDLLINMKQDPTKYDVTKIITARNNAFTGQLDDVTQHVLEGCFTAMEEIATRSDPSIDICEAISHLESMDPSYPYKDPYLAKQLAYMWVNLTLFSPLECSKTILAKYVNFLQSSEEEAIWLKEKAEGVSNRQYQHCRRANRCIRKIKNACTHQYHTMDRDVSEAKESVCVAHAMTKLMEEQAQALCFFDLVEDGAKKTKWVECPNDIRIKVRTGPVNPLKIVGETLMVGTLCPNNKCLNWTMAARATCESCSSASLGSMYKRRK